MLTLNAGSSSLGLIAGMGGWDGIVFTAGIGEHDPAVRVKVRAGLSRLGLVLDNANDADGGTRRISAPGSRVGAWVIPTDEEAVTARHTLAALAQEPDRNG